MHEAPSIVLSSLVALVFPLLIVGCSGPEVGDGYKSCTRQSDCDSGNECRFGLAGVADGICLPVGDVVGGDVSPETETIDEADTTVAIDITDTIDTTDVRDPTDTTDTIDTTDVRDPTDTTDPAILAATYLKTPNPRFEDAWFGDSVSISGNTLVVGEPDFYTVHVFTRSGSAWSLQASLRRPPGSVGGSFGQSVSISGDTIVVGDTWSSGVAHVFTRSDSVWSHQAYLKASNSEEFDYFGGSVSVSGDTIVVGAYWEQSCSDGVNGDEDDNGCRHAGAAYVFTRSGSVWSQQAYLKASNSEGDDSSGKGSDGFGTVSVSGDTIVVGADRESSCSDGVGGNEDDNGCPSAGAAYVFTRNGSVWSQQAYLKASNSEEGDGFGWSVSVSGDTIVVGAGWEDSCSDGVGGNEDNDDCDVAGAAYVFTRSGSVWSQQAYLKASNSKVGERFGAVSISGDTIVVGADQVGAGDCGALGIFGRRGDCYGRHEGAAYIFARSGSVWSQLAYLKASNAEKSDLFGWSVSVSGDAIVVGAVGEDSCSSSDGDNNDCESAGAAYVWSL